MRRILIASVIGMGLAITCGCHPAEEKPMPPPIPNGQPQTEQPAESTSGNPTPESEPANL